MMKGLFGKPTRKQQILINLSSHYLVMLDGIEHELKVEAMKSLQTAIRITPDHKIDHFLSLLEEMISKYRCYQAASAPDAKEFSLDIIFNEMVMVAEGRAI